MHRSFSFLLSPHQLFQLGDDVHREVIQLGLGLPLRGARVQQGLDLARKRSLSHPGIPRGGREMDDRELRLFQHRNGGLGRRLRQGLARPGLLTQRL